MSGRKAVCKTHDQAYDLDGGACKWCEPADRPTEKLVADSGARVVAGKVVRVDIGGGYWVTVDVKPNAATSARSSVQTWERLDVQKCARALRSTAAQYRVRHYDD